MVQKSLVTSKVCEESVKLNRVVVWMTARHARFGALATEKLAECKQFVYHGFMIKHFKCRETEKIFNRKSSRRLPQAIQQRAFMRLNQIHAALVLEDLRLPPSNRLEALSGNRAGQFSIRINGQWRICFVWLGSDAIDVEIVDYH